jgi:hypothetical protein
LTIKSALNTKCSSRAQPCGYCSPAWLHYLCCNARQYSVVKDRKAFSLQRSALSSAKLKADR